MKKKNVHKALKNGPMVYRCVEYTFWADCSTLTSVVTAIAPPPRRTRKKKKKHLRNQKKNKNKKKMLSSKNKESVRPKGRKGSFVLEQLWPWSLTLFFLLLFVSEEFIVMVHGFDALPNGLGGYDCGDILSGRTSTSLCGIVDIWIAGTFEKCELTCWQTGTSTDTITTAEKEAKDTIVAKYGEIEHWDVSQVTIMSFLFYYTERGKNIFNADLSKWNVANVLHMEGSKFLSFT